jgi:hypothetical protein
LPSRRGLESGVHHPADITQTSLPFWVKGSTLATAFLLFGHDSFHDGGRLLPSLKAIRFPAVVADRPKVEGAAFQLEFTTVKNAGLGFCNVRVQSRETGNLNLTTAYAQ